MMNLRRRLLSNLIGDDMGKLIYSGSDFFMSKEYDSSYARVHLRVSNISDYIDDYVLLVSMTYTYYDNYVILPATLCEFRSSSVKGATHEMYREVVFGNKSIVAKTTMYKYGEDTLALDQRQSYTYDVTGYGIVIAYPK